MTNKKILNKENDCVTIYLLGKIFFLIKRVFKLLSGSLIRHSLEAHRFQLIMDEMILFMFSKW